jgi:hypothetical protein
MLPQRGIHFTLYLKKRIEVTCRVKGYSCKGGWNVWNEPGNLVQECTGEGPESQAEFRGKLAGLYSRI